MTDFKHLKLIAYDFDGVMTNNKVYIDQHGNEMVRVNRADGLGVAGIKEIGIEQLIISTEKNKVVKMRAEKLGLPVYQGVDDKKHALNKICKERDVHLSDVAFVGNDINDLEVMRFAGMSICPKDAHNIILESTDIVMNCCGGDGVIREIYNLIIEKNKVKS